MLALFCVCVRLRCFVVVSWLFRFFVACECVSLFLFVWFVLFLFVKSARWFACVLGVL